MKKIDERPNHIIPTKIVNPNHREIHYFYKNRHYAANKCEIIESKYDM